MSCLRFLKMVAVVVAAGSAMNLIAFDPPRKPLNQQEMLALVDHALKEWDVPGVAVVVVERDKVLWLKGQGVRELGATQPMTHETLFPLASCTKAFTSTLIAMLAEDRRLAVDDRIQKHWPEFKLDDPGASESATFRDLLVHRTGLGSHDLLWYRAAWSPEDGVRRAGLLPLDRPFRTAFQYQSSMVAAAGFAAARTAGEPWHRLVEMRIFDPLDMKTASCTTPPSALRASPHRLDREKKLRVIPWYVQAEPNPAGSIHASAQDLIGWLQFQIGDGSWRGRKLLSPSALHELHTPQVALRIEGIHRAANPDTNLMSYALGWVMQDYRGHLLVSHAGALDGFRAHITLMPQDGYALAILANRHQTRMNLALSNTLVDRMLGLTPRDWNKYFRELVQREEAIADEARARREAGRRPDAKPNRPLSDYASRFSHPAYGIAEVTHVDGQLKWKWSGFSGALRHYAGDEFEIDDENLADNAVKFHIENGHVTSLEFLNLPFKKIGPGG
jgi:CubicO group peptidase (beta-lactamase class C family)